MIAPAVGSRAPGRRSHPWFNIDFVYDEKAGGAGGIESFKWNLESSYDNHVLYFLPVVNVESMQTVTGDPSPDVSAGDMCKRRRLWRPSHLCSA